MLDPPWKRPPAPDGKYLVITRSDSETFSNTSPFLIKKTIDSAVGGEVAECKKTRDGNLLIKTKNNLQAEKLMKLTTMPGNIPIQVSEHRSLNSCKGVIYCNDLRGIEEAEILENLKSQKVIEVHKITKRASFGVTSETGLIILTYSLLTLPETINIGYEKINVRPYIPQPMRCMNCMRIGHIAKFCKREGSCLKCSRKIHTDAMTGEECQETPCCINCLENKYPNTNHIPRDRKCPVFITHQEVQAIKTLQKVDNRKAWSIYKQRHQHDGSLYSTVAKSTQIQANQEQKVQQNLAEPSPPTTQEQPSTSNQRKVIKYDDDDEMSTSSISSEKNPNDKSNPNCLVYPKNLTKREKRILKNDGSKSPIQTRSKVKKI